jgi:hypothetical protein
MRMLDVDEQKSIKALQLYLTADEAQQLRDNLDTLLVDPEASEHFHVSSDDMTRDLSCSIVTPRKLEGSGWTNLERAILDED